MTQDEYDFIKKKYGNLIYKISHKITGDIGSCSIEDNIQELWIAAYDALDGYKRQGDGANGTFEEFKDTSGFDKYIKTVLWNNKKTRGIRATKHKEHFGSSVNVQDHKDILPDLSSDTSSVPKASAILPIKLTSEEQKVLKVLLDNPSVIKPSGGIDCTKLSRHLDTYWKRAKYLVDSIKMKMENSQ